MPVSDAMSAVEADRAALTDHGLRVTRTRLAVLRALSQHPHADAEALHLVLSREGTKVSVQSVHNVLSDLHRVGLVRRFEPARSSARFERRVDDNHHHAVCERCGAVEDIDCVTNQAPCLEASTATGFELHGAEVTFWGLCARCAAEPAETVASVQAPRGPAARHPRSPAPPL